MADRTRDQTETDASVVPTVETALAPTETPGEPVGPAADLVGQKLDRYEVTARLGEGGMGVVYAARDPALDRKIALKVLRGVGDEHRAGFEARLRREAQALARLDHPNVIAVYDVGVAAQSVFIAMQLVDGTTLADLLADDKPPPRRVLALFVAAARGLAAAHAAGIVHRDFKPSNVLVDRVGRVCVGDFGLARGAGADDDVARTGTSGDSLLHEDMTRDGAVVGTPLFMAPEQHDGGSVTAATDQFSFCVSLWMALFGQHPFAAGKWRSADARVAMEHDRVRDPPRRRGVSSRVVAALRRGMRHAPSERWPSLGALAARLEPRSRIAWLGGGLTLAGIAGGIALATAFGGRGAGDPCSNAALRLDGSWTPALHAHLADAFAATGLDYARDSARDVVDGLDAYAARWRDMRLDTCRANRVRHDQSDELFDRRVRCLDQRLAELDAMITIYTGSPSKDEVDAAASAVQALPALDACADTDTLLSSVPPPADPAVRAQADALGEQVATAHATLVAGRYDGMVAQTRAVEAQASALGWDPLIARAQMNVGIALSDGDDTEAAIAETREAALSASRGRDDGFAARALREVAGMLDDNDQPDQALAVVTDAEVVSARGGSDPINELYLAETRGDALHSLSRYPESDAAYQQAEQILLAHWAPDDVELGGILNNRANLCNDWGHYDQAIALLQRGIPVLEAKLGADHPNVGMARNNLAIAYLFKGDYVSARREFEHALAIKQKRLPPGSTSIATTIHNLGLVALGDGRVDDAERLFRQALDMRLAVLPADHASVLQSKYQLAMVARVRGHYDDAIAGYQEVLAAREKKLGEDSEPVGNVLDALGTAYFARGDLDDATTFRQRALAVREKVLGPDAGDVAESRAGLAELDLARGDCATAVDEAHRALAILDKSSGSPGDRSSPLAIVAECDARAGRIAAARAGLTEALAGAVSGGGEPDTLAELRYQLAQVEWRAGDHDSARAHATAARDGYGKLGRDVERDAIARWLAAHAR